jgi:hypothetical protein
MPWFSQHLYMVHPFLILSHICPKHAVIISSPPPPPLFLSYYTCHNAENHNLDLFYMHEASVLFHCVDKLAVVVKTSTWYLREKLTQISSEFFVVAPEVDGFCHWLKVNSRTVLSNRLWQPPLNPYILTINDHLPISFSII